MMDENMKNISGEAPEAKTGVGTDGMADNLLTDDETEKVAGGRGKIYKAASNDERKKKPFSWNPKR